MKQNTEWDIKQQVRKIGCQYTGATEMEIKHIGGGFYGRVYRLTFGSDSRRL